MTSQSPQEIAHQLGSGLLSFPVTHLRADHSFDEAAYRDNIGWLGQFAGRRPLRRRRHGRILLAEHS